MFFSRTQPTLVSAQDALPGRAEGLADIPQVHFINGNQIRAPFPEGVTTLVVGMGCFWAVSYTHLTLPTSDLV